MKCSKCGFEAATNDVFCPQCGERLIPEEAPISAFKAKLLPALRDPLFLLMCILMSVSCFFSIALSSSFAAASVCSSSACSFSYC